VNLTLMDGHCDITPRAPPEQLDWRTADIAVRPNTEFLSIETTAYLDHEILRRAAEILRLEDPRTLERMPLISFNSVSSQLGVRPHG
jgi:hypothetical protein